MRRTIRRFGLRFFAVTLATSSALLVVAACVDVTPIHVEKRAPEAAPPPPVDAGEDAPDANRAPPCLGCLEDRCSALTDTCKEDPRCAPAYTCIVHRSCFDLPTLQDKIECGLPCAVEAGISAIEDPVVQVHLAGMIACAQEKCVVECNFGDAAVP